MSACDNRDASHPTKQHIGYSSPLEAVKNGPKETLVYVTCINAAWSTNQKPDYLATIDLDPTSPTYSQVIHTTEVPNVGDELHHMGWNACSSCRDCKVTRSRLIVPGLNSDRIYVINTETNPRSPVIEKVIEPAEVHNADAGAPHTVHCLPTGDIMISCMGNAEESAKGTFLILEQGTFNVKGTWQLENDSTEFNYDYWYQPRHNVMISTEWASPRIFRKGFFVQDFKNKQYGHSINVWDWTTRKRLQRLDLGEDGHIPLEVRFLHNPDSTEGFVGCAFSSTIVRFYKTEEHSWATETVVKVLPKIVKNWSLPEMPGLITDILISLDDRYLYFSNWLHGDVRQYDLSDTRNPKLVGQIFLGGSICRSEKVETVDDPELQEQLERKSTKGIPIRGGPQMLQLSLDGKRLYVTNSLFSAWDAQFYPENIEKGSMMLKINVDTENGGLTLDEDFMVDFGCNILAHEMRFPGGDCTSDIWE